jgi:hypothetical protein
MSKYISYDSDDKNSKDRFSNIFLKHIADWDDDDGCKEACHRLEMRSRLIRRNTGKIICINDYEDDGCHKRDMEGFFQHIVN